MKNKVLIFLLLIVSIVSVVGCGKKEEKEIILDTLFSHEYYESRGKNIYFYIDSLEEFKVFTNNYEEDLEKYKSYLNSGYSIFIETIQESSGSISNTFSEVKFENNRVEFVIESRIPDVGTEDMALWYMIAVIPNDKLDGLDLSGWIKPSEKFDS